MTTITRDALVGTWRLVGYGASGPPAASRVAAAEDGRLMYGGDGHVAVAMRRTDGYWGYCGHFEVEGDTVIHHIVLGMAPATPGSAQHRHATLEGNRLTLAVREPGTQVELVWERTRP